MPNARSGRFSTHPISGMSDSRTLRLLLIGVLLAVQPASAKPNNTATDSKASSAKTTSTKTSHPTPLPEKVTFAEHIASLVYAQCTECHRPGQAGPFSLITYRDVSKRAKMIQSVITDGFMPPWKPVAGHGQFKNERRLTKTQIALFDRWVEQGRPLGDAAKQPAAPTFDEEGWALGKPDLILKMEKPFKVPASGPDIYRWFVLKLRLPEDKWVKAVEFRPSARSVVHHSLLFLDSSGEARKLDGKDGQPGFSGMRVRISGRLGGYVPGTTPAFFPKDLALPIVKGTDILLQTHFHPTGKIEVEQSQLAIYFADRPPSRQLVPIQVPPGFGRGAGIDVPAGEQSYKVQDRFEIPVDVNAWSISGHAHYICKEMRMTAKLPNGQTRSLLYIDDWDLDWQDNYQFKQPVKLPAGTVVETTLIYDNSASNPSNPFSPPRRIKWGRESTDEMGSITMQVTAVDAKDERKLKYAVLKNQRKLASGVARQAGKKALAATFKRLDKNKDGKLQRSETPPRLRDRLFKALDLDNNNELDQKELKGVADFLRTQRR